MGSALPCLFLDMASPPHRILCLLKSPVIITFSFTTLYLTLVTALLILKIKEISVSGSISWAYTKRIRIVHWGSHITITIISNNSTGIYSTSKLAQVQIIL